MAGLQKVAGSALYIGGRVPYKSIIELADFSGQTWTRITGWTQTGDLGAEQATITQTLIDHNITLYDKGVISFPIMANTFAPNLSDPGQVAFAAAQRSCKPYAFRIVWGADCEESSVVTITNAEPAIVAWDSHGFEAGTPVVLSTTGSLPTGLTAGTTYYVVDPTTNAFGLAATVGGDAIATTSAGSGIHTATAVPVGETDLLFGFAMRGVKTGGDASASRLLSMPIQPIAEYLTV